MKKWSGGREGMGFTLVELMVVVIIIGILAAIAVPLYTSQANRAKTSEAVVGLGAIREAERVYFAEHSAYLAVAAGNVGNEPNAATPGLGLDCSKNTYYDAACFSVVLDATYGFIATGDGTAAGNAAPRKGDVSKTKVEMRGNGQVRYSYDSGSTWTSWQ